MRECWASSPIHIYAPPFTFPHFASRVFLVAGGHFRITGLRPGKPLLPRNDCCWLPETVQPPVDLFFGASTERPTQHGERSRILGTPASLLLPGDEHHKKSKVRFSLG